MVFNEGKMYKDMLMEMSTLERDLDVPSRSTSK